MEVSLQEEYWLDGVKYKVAANDNNWLATLYFDSHKQAASCAAQIVLESLDCLPEWCEFLDEIDSD
ncbi:MAG: hypothetical protein JSU72_15245 [Deltaproteobacteria bacterium]|nr:MAG: hypothetical protein JSU72_15245 [Deltaproteobacteria bacterium]